MISYKLRSIKQRLRRYSCQLMQFYDRKTLWLSLGENCLTDSILQRYRIKSFSTLYSHGRSNMDYAIFLERNNYEDILNFENLKYSNINEDKVVRSILVNSSDHIYSELHMNGFEFTHHNVIESKKDRESSIRKIQRLQTIRGTNNVVFFYHHRMNKNSDLDSLFNKAFEFSKFYTLNGKNCHMVIFSQRIINDNSDRNIYYKSIHSGIHYFEFWTKEIWEGNNSNIFWAIIDDDLIYKMIKTSIRLIKFKHKIANGVIR